MRQPNMLFLFPDQWRWDWLGCEDSPYGKVPVRTPHIDALAKRGVRFTQCRTNSPLCAPARAALAQGVRYERCGVPNNQYDTDPNSTTVFRLLRDAGYRTATCGKNDLHKKTAWKGHDGWTQMLGQYGFCDAIDQSGKLDAQNNGHVSKGGPNCSYTSHLHAHGLFETFSDDYTHRQEIASNVTATDPSPLPREHYTDDFCGQKALELMDRFPQEGPWMLWVNWPGPHDPFDPPRALQARYDKVDFSPPVDGSECDEQQRRIDHNQIRRNYAAACEGIDEWVGRIIDKVTQRGELANTVIIFASDHGEMLGDHQRFTKHVAYEGSVHVPLIMAGPGVDAGRTCDDLIELIDLSATMLDLAGLEVPNDWDAQPAIGSKYKPRAWQYSSLDDWKMVCDGRYKYIEEKNGKPSNHQIFQGEQAQRVALFDLLDDPQESVNLANDKPQVVQRLREALHKVSTNSARS